MSSRARLRFLFPALGFVFLLAFWCTTGTLTPYAASHAFARSRGKCQYLVNGDHPQFEWTFNFLNGKPRSKWDHSVVLRRMLYPVLAYPLMAWLGFMAGGILASLLIQCMAIVGFLWWVWRKFGDTAARVGAVVLSTYPGIFYWSGLPYSYCMIVPCTLMSGICLWEISEAKTARSQVPYFFVLGILFLGYDLLPYFGLATVLILAAQRRFLSILIAVPLMALPVFALLSVLKSHFGVSPLNSNTQVYVSILRSYLNPGDLGQWFSILLDVPVQLVLIYFFSNFFFLPLAFLPVVYFGWRKLGVRLALPEVCVLLAILAVFLFANAAPPYTARWQIRGANFSRYYQPVFIVFLLYLMRVGAFVFSKESRVEPKLAKAFVGTVAAVFVLNGAIVFGMLVRSPLTDEAFYRFNRHSARHATSGSIACYGVRPYGFCQYPKVGLCHRRPDGSMERVFAEDELPP